MTTSPRRLNSAENDENCQKWPKLTFKRPANHFFTNFKIPISDLKSAYQTASEKNKGSEVFRQKFRRGHPTVHLVANHPETKHVVGTCRENTE